MIDFKYEFTCTCDAEGCKVTEKTSNGTRAGFERELHQKGWLINENKTYCPDCYKKINLGLIDKKTGKAVADAN